MLSLGEVGAASGVTVPDGFVKGVAVGVVLAMIIFIRVLRISLVRSRHSAAVIPSRRVHPTAVEKRLLLLRPRVQVLDLEGALCFGNVEKLQRAAAAAVSQDPAFWC